MSPVYFNMTIILIILPIILIMVIAESCDNDVWQGKNTSGQIIRQV